MNEALIKYIIKFKLTTAEKVLDHLPLELSNNLKNIGNIILESITESSKQPKDPANIKTKLSNNLKNIKIE